MKAPDEYSCKQVFERLDDYVDRELSQEEIRLIERHLDDCTECADEAGFESKFVAEVRAKLKRLDLPPDLIARISRKIEECD